MSTRSPMAVADLPFGPSAIARSTRDLLAADPIARIRRVDPSRVMEDGLGVADDTVRALLDRVPVRRRRSRRRRFALGVALLVGSLSVIWLATSRTRRSAAAAIRRDEATARADVAPDHGGDASPWIGAQTHAPVPEANGSPGALIGSGPADATADVPADSSSPVAPTDEAAVRRTSVEIGMVPRD